MHLDPAPCFGREPGFSLQKETERSRCALSLYNIMYHVYPAEVGGKRLLLLVPQKVFVQHTGLDSGIVLVFAGLVFLIVA